MKIIGKGWTRFNITIIEGVRIIGGGVAVRGEIGISRFLGKHIAFIYLCEQ